MKKKKKKLSYQNRRDTFLDNFKSVIKKHSYDLPDKLSRFTKIKNNSWFNISKTKDNNNFKNNNKINDIKLTKTKQITNSIKIEMILNNNQKNIIDKWFNSYTQMYNETLRYIKNKYPYLSQNVSKNRLKNSNHQNKNINFYDIRKNLKNIKNELIIKSNSNKKLRIYCHTLDQAIKLVITNYKSAITNTNSGNFKRFNIRKWKTTRPSQSIDFEKENFNDNNKLAYNKLGYITFKFNGKIYNNLEDIIVNGKKIGKITKMVKINKNLITNKYHLIIPKDNDVLDNRHKNKGKIISLDPGLRTFMTGLSDKNAKLYGKDSYKTIKKMLEKKYKIMNNKNISSKIRKKNEMRINRKIFWKIEDLHWKTIKDLTSNYNNILLGDMSAKSIVRKNKCKNKSLFTKLKDACLKMRFYQFRQRLEYKCKLNGIGYQLVNEYYTSKTCSICCHYNDKLKSEKIYECQNCGCKIDRDINGCRNIYMKSLRL